MPTVSANAGSDRSLRVGAAVLATLLCVGRVNPLEAQAPPAGGRDYRSLSRQIFQELIEIKTTESGVGSTLAAEAVARRLRAAGYAEADLQVIGPVAHKKNVVVRLPGSGKAKPLLIIGHLDVVEARKEDWSADLDPFTFVERDGYFYGRGTQDMKGAAAIAVTNFIRWKQDGWVPSRTLVLALTADEELYGDENGVAWLMKNHRELMDAEYSLNSDGGDFETRDGKPFSVAVAAGEKKETILQLETHNRGGHGSVPRKDNAIYELGAALARIEKLRFPVLLNEVTRAQFAALAALESGQTAADMKAVSASPRIRPRSSAFRRIPTTTPCFGPPASPRCWTPGTVRAPCLNARAVINCRIVPGHTAADMLQSLRQAIADDGVAITWQFNEPSDPPASPLRPDVLPRSGRRRTRCGPA